MAATDIQYGGLDPVLYTPDLSFLKYVLDKKTSNYEQGLKSASSAFNVLKKALTDPTNVEKRNQYLKDAQSQLQTIASSDLSLQQNVNYANSIFEPIAADPAFAFDTMKTQQNRQQNEIMNEWANSSDPEVRKQYNPEIQRWMNRDMDVLRNGNGDINNYKNFKDRKALAYIDPLDILSKAIKDNGFEFKQDFNGRPPYIITQEGGPGGKKNYYEFAKNILSNDQAYIRQQQVLAEATAEDVLDLYKDRTDLTNDQKYYDYGLTHRTLFRKDQEKYLTDLQNSLNADDAEILKYENDNKESIEKGQNDVASGNNQTEDAQNYLHIMGLINQRASLKKDLEGRKTLFEQTFNTDDADFAKTFAENPKKYFYNSQFENDIQRFVNVKSASTKTKITADQGYLGVQRNELIAMKNTFDQLDDMQDNMTDQQKLALQRLKLEGKGIKTIKNDDGTTTEKKETSSIKVGSASATTGLYTFDALKTMREQVELDKATLINAMSGAQGGLSFLSSIGVSNEDVSKIKKLFTEYVNSEDPNKTTLLTETERNLLYDVGQKLLIFGQKEGTLESGDVENLTVRNFPNLLKKAMSNYTVRNMNEVQSFLNMKSYDDVSQNFINRNNAFKAANAAVITTLSKEDKFKPIIKDGKLIDESYVEAGLPKTIDAAKRKKIAKAYINGTLRYEHNITVDEAYETITLEDGTYFERSTIDGKFFPNIPNPEKFKELRKEVNLKTAQIIPEYAEKAGMMLSNPRFLLTGTIAEDLANELSDPSQTNADIYEYPDGSSESKQVSTDDGSQLVVRDALKDKKNIVGATVFTASDLNNGGMVVSVSFKDSEKPDDKKPKWAGKTYYFPISMNETTPEMITSLQQVKESGVYEQYKKEGKTYEYNTFAGMGIKYSIRPNMPGDDISIIEIWHKPWDPKQNKYKDEWEHLDNMNPTTTFNTKDVTFPEMQQSLFNNVISLHLQQYIKYLQDVEVTKKSKPELKPFDAKRFLK